MIIPLHDDNHHSSFPLVNYLIMGLCTVVFGYMIWLNEDAEIAFLATFGLTGGDFLPVDHSSLSEIEKMVVSFRETSPWHVSPWATLFSYQFLHAGWLHIIGNMWFLWIFGDNVEHAMGHVRYVLFFLICGALSGAAQFLMEGASLIPIVGASGALSAVMGAYMWLYPKKKVTILFAPLFPFLMWRTQAKAVTLVLFFFVWDFVNGMITLGDRADTAFWAHVGGVIVGILLLPVFRDRSVMLLERKHVHKSLKRWR